MPASLQAPLLLLQLAFSGAPLLVSFAIVVNTVCPKTGNFACSGPPAPLPGGRRLLGKTYSEHWPLLLLENGGPPL